MTDRTVVRAVVFGLVGALLLCIGGFIALSIAHIDVPEILKSIALTVLGAVAGVLSKTNTEVPTEPTPVTVVANTPKRRDRGDIDVLKVALVALIVVVILVLLKLV